jgi:hypothetical protein
LTRRSGSAAFAFAFAVAVLLVSALAVPALAADGTIGAGGTPSGDQTGCAPGACTYVALGSLAGRAPANGTLTSFTLGHGSVGTATTATLDVFSQSGSTITLVRQSAPQPLPAGPAATTVFDLSGAPLQIAAGQIIGVTLTPTSGYAPSAVRSAGTSSNSSRTCEGTPMTGQQFSCGSIDVNASTVTLSAFFFSDIRPPAITPQSPSGVGPFDATVNALVDPNGAATTAVVHYGTSAGNLSSTTLAQNLGSGDGDVAYSQHLSNLQPGTTYYYAISATNETDTTTTNPPASFTTDPAPPPDIAENASPSALSGTAATLTAQVNPQGAATSFRVLYGTSDPPTGQLESAASAFAASRSTQSYSADLTGLTPDTTYFWQVAAYRGGVKVATSPIHQFTTFHPPDVALGTVGDITSNSATLNGTVTPHGQAVTWHFEYGKTTAYGASTAGQGTSGSVSASVNGLDADTDYHWRLVASSAGGSAESADGTFHTAAAPSNGGGGTDIPIFTGGEVPVFTAETLPPPVIGVNANAEREKGTVLIKLPEGTSAAKADALGLHGAAAGFVPLTEARQIPIGSTLDTTDGTVKLITAGGAGSANQPGHFNGGQFTVAQSKKNPLTTMSMGGGGLAGCGTRVPSGGAPKPATAARKRRRLLHSSVRGHFATRGRNSVATVRGTEWTMTDTCKGTLAEVKNGTVQVRDLTLRKNVLVHAGDSYLARAPLRKKRKRN